MFRKISYLENMVMAAAFFILLSAHVIHANEGKSRNSILFGDVGGEWVLEIFHI